MPETIQDVMSRDPVCIDSNKPLTDAARLMEERDIGDVLVTRDGGDVCGIVTDRDIVVRAIAHGKDAASTMVGEICSNDVTTVKPGDPIDVAIRIMREKAIRRLPVVEGSRAVGIVSIGDIALEKDPGSALADISAAPPNE